MEGKAKQPSAGSSGYGERCEDDFEPMVGKLQAVIGCGG